MRNPKAETPLEQIYQFCKEYKYTRKSDIELFDCGGWSVWLPNGEIDDFYHLNDTEKTVLHMRLNS